MILTRTENGLLVVRQPEHGHQTGLFAAQWGNDEVAAINSRRESIELASTHHDDGWATWELHPTLDPSTNQPVQFYSLTPREHIPLYRAGIARAAAIDPFAGILVSMHGAGLYNDRYGTFRLVDLDLNAEEQLLVREFLHDMEIFQSALAIGIGLASNLASESHISTNREVCDAYLRLQVWDRLSLQYVFRLAQDNVIGPLPVGDGTTTQLTCKNSGPFSLMLDPYPFQDNGAVFPIQAVTIADRQYKTPEDFLQAIRDAPTSTIECRAMRTSSGRK